MLAFTPGLELCRRFYEEAVRPLLEQHFPDLPYAAALIGPSSDVLGFDTEMSMDHFWGPRLQIFLRDQDIPFAPRIDEILRNSLPHIFEGFPVDVVEVPDEPGVTLTAMCGKIEPMEVCICPSLLSSKLLGLSTSAHRCSQTSFYPLLKDVAVQNAVGKRHRKAMHAHGR